MGTHRGMTIALKTGDTTQALAVYSAIIGRKPDFSAHDDFHEWEICQGSWLQLSTGHTTIVATSSRVRFEVRNIEEEIARLRTQGVDVDEPTTLPRVVIFTDFKDPWGNNLGLYQDIAGPEGPVAVGGSALDPSHFVPGVVEGDRE